MTACRIDRDAVGAPMSKPGDAPGRSGEFTFQVHDQNDGDTGHFAVQHGSHLAAAVTYAAVTLMPSPDEEIKREAGHRRCEVLDRHRGVHGEGPRPQLVPEVAPVPAATENG